MRIHDAADPYLAAGTISFLLGAWLCLAGCGPWTLALAGAGAAFAAACAFFFRDPERPLPADASKLYAPGDGRVLSVEPGPAEGPWTLRIFLSIFDVHVQRYPCAGTVTRVERVRGGFAMAMRPEASRNDRVLVALRPAGREAEIEVEQIAGAIARRIQCSARPGAPAAAGARYGLIHFGSQVALRLPPSARPLVKPGDRVVGGITPIAEWN